ncbi:MAG: hypothetical protein GY928_36450 [Colwellia sp.]|nr:hypothetical protein [Colwellia sp.]
MTLPMIGGDFFTRDFTVWPKVMNNNGYPGASFGDPVLMKCWFKATNEISKNASGQERVSKFKVLTFGDNLPNIKEGDYIVVGRDETLTLDPTALDDAIDIHSVGVTAADALGSQDLITVMV